jgi:hypothetical protein
VRSRKRGRLLTHQPVNDIPVPRSHLDVSHVEELHVAELTASYFARSSMSSRWS